MGSFCVSFKIVSLNKLLNTRSSWQWFDTTWHPSLKTTAEVNRGRSSLYGGHVNLGMIFLGLGWHFCLGVILFLLVSISYLGVIYWILVWFFSSSRHFHLSVILFDSMVLFYILDLVQSTASWYDFLRFGRLFRLGVILSDLVSFHILVRITESWCDTCVLDGDIFLYASFYSCM